MPSGMMMSTDAYGAYFEMRKRSAVGGEIGVRVSVHMAQDSSTGHCSRLWQELSGPTTGQCQLYISWPI